MQSILPMAYKFPLKKKKSGPWTQGELCLMCPGNRGAGLSSVSLSPYTNSQDM